MEVTESQSRAPPPPSSSSTPTVPYTLKPAKFPNEDILFCIDVGPEAMIDMKVTASSGRAYTRLDGMKQAILLFMNAKLTINPFHRFAFSVLGKSAAWLKKEFTSDANSAIAVLNALTVDATATHADLTNLLKAATLQAQKSRAQGRILRVVLLYCRSSIPPHHQWVAAQKLFTLDVIYLHDKPGPDNCPQKVYDSLVDALEHVSEYEGYIYESGQGLTRTLFRHMCVLLSHPQQRCTQDDIDLPKSLSKKLPVTDSATPGDEVVAMSS